MRIRNTSNVDKRLGGAVVIGAGRELRLTSDAVKRLSIRPLFQSYIKDGSIEIVEGEVPNSLKEAVKMAKERKTKKQALTQVPPKSSDGKQALTGEQSKGDKNGKSI